MLKRLLFLVTILLLVFVVAAAPVFAVIDSLSGTITVGDPTMSVVFISSPSCSGQGASLVLYHAHLFSVDITGDYDISVLSDGGFASFYLMDSGFNPAAAFPNCIIADNSGNPVTGTASLVAGTLYYLVVFDDSFAQLGGAYTASMLLRNRSTCSTPLPVGSAIYNVPLGAPAYYAADSATRVTFDLPAGNWYISEFSNGFAHIWISCQANMIWIPETAVTR